jgi:hypothetical protein
MEEQDLAWEACLPVSWEHPCHATKYFVGFLYMKEMMPQVAMCTIGHYFTDSAVVGSQEMELYSCTTIQAT